MPGLRDEVRSCLSSLVEGADELVGTFAFPADFIGFGGHFPNNPVLPGVCAIQATLVMLESHFRAKVRLLRVVSAKFLKVVRPGEECTWSSSVRDGQDRSCRVRTIVTRGSDRIAVLDLLVGLSDEREK